MNLKIKRLENSFALPEYKTDGAAGMDLYAATKEDETICIPEGGIAIIPTGISIAVPQGYEAQIRPRSGLATKGITVVNSPGTIDSDYRGEVCVILANLRNTAENDDALRESVTALKAEYAEKQPSRITTVIVSNHFFVNRGDRIAQMVIAPVERATLVEVEELDDTERGSGGFGHTGIR